MIAYTSWDGKQMVWDVRKTGFYFLRVSQKIENTNGSYFNETTMGQQFDTLADVQHASQAIWCVRPDLRDVVRPVKAPCALDACKTYVDVSAWS